MDLASSLVFSGIGGSSIGLLTDDGVVLLGALGGDGGRLATLSLPNLHAGAISLVTKSDLGVKFSRNRVAPWSTRSCTNSERHIVEKICIKFTQPLEQGLVKESSDS